MANVVITGGAGFLGGRLARDLLAAGSLDVAGAGERPLSQVTLIDQVPAPPDLAAHARAAVIQGDLTGVMAPGQAGREAVAGADVVFHLAAAVSGECEADFDLGIRANLRGTEAVLAACRAAGTPAGDLLQLDRGLRRVSRPPASGRRGRPDTANPQTSYGIQKFIGEQLVADYTRKGFLRGRSIRLMTVSVRPGRPNAAASGFMSGIIREPLGASVRSARRSRHRGGAGLPREGYRGAAVCRRVAGRCLGRPYRGDHARPHGDGR